MLSDYQTLVDDLVRDDAGKIGTSQRDAAIATAVIRYSDDRPRRTVADVIGAGQMLDVPAGWVRDFSVIESIEYPVGKIPPRRIAADRHCIYESPDGPQIQLLDALAAASALRVCYTVRHLVGDTDDTIPLSHREAVANYAAAILCDQLSALYANESDSTIQADSVQQGSKSAAYRSKARDYRKAYQDALGVQEKTSVPAGVVVQLNGTDSFGGPRLQHPPRRLQ